MWYFEFIIFGPIPPPPICETLVLGGWYVTVQVGAARLAQAGSHPPPNLETKTELCSVNTPYYTLTKHNNQSYGKAITKIIIC